MSYLGHSIDKSIFVDVLLYLCRVAVAGYCNKIYKLPTDDYQNATKYKEAPIVDNSTILSDEQTLRDRENQSKYVTIPKEVSLIDTTTDTLVMNCE